MSDADLLPKPKVEQPDARRLPFGPSGVLLPDGPEFPAVRAAPDIVGLPWRRDPGEEWTTPAQRLQVRQMIKLLFAANRGRYVAWYLRERDHLQVLSATRLQAPLLALSIERIDRIVLVATQVFDHAARYSAVEFVYRLTDLRVALLAQDR
jgi:hypothetical protein